MKVGEPEEHHLSHWTRAKDRRKHEVIFDYSQWSENWNEILWHTS